MAEDTQYDLKLGLDTGLAKNDVDTIAHSLVRVGRVADSILAKTDRSAASVAHFGASSRKAAEGASLASNKTDKMATSVAKADRVMGKAVKTAIATATAWFSLSTASAAITSTVDVFGDVETALVSVQKTTGIVGPELQSLLGDVTDLAVDGVPLLTTELLELGAAAGQVGVEGSENILRYIETFGKLTASTDLQGEEAVKLLTRLLNVQGEGPEEITRMANVLVRLGNTTAASEREITRHTSEVGRSTAQFKIGSTQALAYGAALAEIGTRAEGGGTAIGRTMRIIQKAVSDGGEALEGFANVAQVSAEDFAETWNDDPVKALNLFLRGLRRFGTDMGSALEDVGLKGDELAKVLPVLAENFELLAKSQRNAADEAERQTALNREAGAAFDTLQKDLQRARNAYKLTQEAAGRGLAPALRSLLLDLRDFFVASKDSARALGEDLGTAIKLVGGLLLLLLKNIDLVKSALLAFLALKIAVFFTAFVGSIGKAVVALKAYVVATTAAATSTAALGATVTRTSPILDQFGRNFIVTEAAAGKGATAMQRFLSTGITPMAIGLTALLGLVILVNSAIGDWSAKLTREMREIRESSEEFFDGIKKIKDASDLLLDVAEQEAEIQKRLLAAGLRSDDEGAELIRAQVAAEFQQQRVDLLYEQEEALTAAIEKERDYRAELDATVAKIPELEAARDKARDALVPTEFGVIGMDDFAEASAAVKKAEEDQTRLTKAWNEAHIEANTLRGTVENLRTTSEDYVPTVIETGDETERLTKELKEQRAELAKTKGDLDAELKAREKLISTLSNQASTIDDVEEAMAEAADASATSQRFQAEASRLTAINNGELLQLNATIRLVIESERELAGALTVAGLRAQAKALEEVRLAYGRSNVAGLAAQQILEQESKFRANAKDAALSQRDAIRALTFEVERLAVISDAVTAGSEIARQTEGLERIAAAYKQNTVAGQQMARQVQTENDIRRATAPLLAQEVNLRDELLVKQFELQQMREGSIFCPRRRARGARRADHRNRDGSWPDPRSDRDPRRPHCRPRRGARGDRAGATPLPGHATDRDRRRADQHHHRARHCYRRPPQPEGRRAQAVPPAATRVDREAIRGAPPDQRSREPVVRQRRDRGHHQRAPRRRCRPLGGLRRYGSGRLQEGLPRAGCDVRGGSLQLRDLRRCP